ncbi:mandelate racemase/muconate lactonizing enzyme family protein [Georgenia alba]|uniref:Mandelate racemase/muconate lactonizing enzyme family protein n=1 Tax=Georgenia alba TaxID=2233858 RepID=A0ABW2QEB0_9MICO
MRITDVQVDQLRVPVRYPLHEKDAYAPVVLLRLITDDGRVGTAASTHPQPESLAAFCRHTLAPQVIGMDPRRPTQLRSKLLVKTSQRSVQGVWSRAASLLDVACWDLKGLAAGEPIWRLLGGARSTVQTYVTFGLASYSQDELCEAGRLLVAAGHKGLKMVVGAGSSASGDDLFGLPSDDDVVRDAQRVAALREAVGPSVKLMIDANKNFTLPQALRLSKLVEDLDLTWFEDPILMADARLMGELRRRTDLAIAAGGLGTGDVVYMREYIEHRAVDVIQPNVRDIGGYTGALATAHLAEAYNMAVGMGGSEPHLNIHLYGAIAMDGPVEYHIQGWEFAKKLYSGLPEPEDGLVRLTEEPGLGLILREDAVAEFRVETH